MKRLALMAMLMAGTAGAADFSDPDWPCIQRKQPHLSLGSVWSGPLPDAAVEELAKAPEVQALAQRLEQRRLPVEEAEALIAEFAQGKDAQQMAALYLATFERIDALRSRVMNGIARYAHKQEALDAQIDERRAEMSKLEAAESPDFDRIDALEEQLDWDTRVFRDRQQSLTYVCETPVILEQRAFALGRAVAAHLPE
ncbi:hypothetical protein FAZ78_08645 [Cereibacter changlensis]|uniref:Uncharacterized protein n=2 Tax=Cereibacter changlensis TaxID=402884 RepID=A0A2T4JUD4_9RHOB|nr:hypothetical protein [Cereibacter changlensis]PTE21486.1 hypothetical protein C5F48_12045 [Cereibacter changlensis JA139]PZX52857.1 hypothetical protein LX76_02488 [Cereibacter changlensis]TKA96949.1 hypothetical protein FAZ78_08645 [Cereibacter changlensis]